MPDPDDRLRVFISWSGLRSRIVANGVRTWLDNILDEPEVWLSADDIPDGSRWSQELAQALERADFGVIVLTPENLASPWILFEAGALSKHLRDSRVLPYLVGIDRAVLAGPLAQFQAVSADREGSRRLLMAVVEATKRKPSSDAVARRFEAFWPELESILVKAREARAYAAATQSSDSKDAPLVAALQAQVAELTVLVRQLVVPDRAAASSAATRGAAPFDLSKLEGAWVSEHSHMYIRVIDGCVLAPYCYEGDKELTADYYDWQPFADQFFTRFRWFDHPVKGFAFYKLVSNDRIEGMWWLAPDMPVDSFVEVPKTGGARAEWQRVVGAKTPQWAETYFRDPPNKLA